MKFIGSWECKYIGIVYNKMAYYFAWNHPDCRDFGYTEDYYDGPIKRISAYFISFQWHFDYNHHQG